MIMMLSPMPSSCIMSGARLALYKRPLYSRVCQLSFSSSSDTKSNRVETTFNSSGTIAHVQLNRPDKLNALDLPMFYAIREAAQSLQDNNNLRVIVLSGKGRAFCTGLDVPSLLNTKILQTSQQLLHKDMHTISNLAQDVAYIWRKLNVPVICALHGMCYGGGMQIALGADMRYASVDCKLAIMEAKWGLIPDMTATVTLRELVRLDIAKELTMTGRVVSAQEAVEYGLVTRVAEDPLEEAQKMAEKIVQQSPDAIAWTKKMYQKTWVAASEQECLQIETEAQTKLMGSWNQIAKSANNFGWSVPFRARKAIADSEIERHNVQDKK